VRIAVVTADWPAFAPGGVATLTRALARGLSRLGAEVEVWTRGGGGRDALLAREDEAFPVRAIPGRSWRRRGARHWARGLPRLLDRFAPDAVIASTWDVVPGVRHLLPGLFVFAHGRDITGAMEPARERLRSEVLASPAGWFCLTDWMRGRLAALGVPAHGIHRVPAAVDEVVAPPGGTGGEPLRVLQVGRLIPRKGQDVAIRAAALLGGKARLTLVGEGPDRSRLQRLAGRHVELRGALQPAELERAWRQADVAVMVAREEPGGDTEGYGLVYLEAGARGLPVVGGRSAGSAEAVIDGVTGLQVEGEVGLARALERLADDRELGRRLGRAGRERYERCGRPEHLARSVLEALA